jgi:hypothetical protein
VVLVEHHQEVGGANGAELWGFQHVLNDILFAVCKLSCRLAGGVSALQLHDDSNHVTHETSTSKRHWVLFRSKDGEECSSQCSPQTTDVPHFRRFLKKLSASPQLPVPWRFVMNFVDEIPNKCLVPKHICSSPSLRFPRGELIAVIHSWLRRVCSQLSPRSHVPTLHSNVLHARGERQLRLRFGTSTRNPVFVERCARLCLCWPKRLAQAS